MDSLDDVFDRFGGPAEMARATGIRDGHLRTMKTRGSIPPDYWPQIVDAARERGIGGIDFEALARLAAKRPNGEENAA